LTPQTTTDWTVELDGTGFTGSRRPTPAARPSACAVRVPRPCLGRVTAPPPSRWRGPSVLPVVAPSMCRWDL
jgi:hypothetical protein